MTSLRTYAVVSLLFTASYALSLFAIFSNTWLHFRTPEPFRFNESYGLWKKCDIFGQCRYFPDDSIGDCKEYNFCTKWHVAQASMAISGFLGATVLIVLLGLLFASYAQQYKGWRSVASLLTLHAACQIISTLFIHDLYSSSSRFYFGTNYDISFLFCIASWIIDVILAVALTLVAITSPPAYYPL